MAASLDGRARGRPPGSAEERAQLRGFLDDFARELHDGAPLSATITRVLRLFRTAGVPRARWGDVLYQARAITQEHSGQITRSAGEGAFWGTKNKMPYFLAVVESLIGLRPAAGGPAAPLPAPPIARTSRAGRAEPAD